MRPVRDIAVFVLLVITYSTLIALLTRNILTSSLVAVACVSVILAARGVGWKRRGLFALIGFVGFALFDKAYDLFGLTDRLATFGSETIGTVLGLTYIVVTFAYPLAVLVAFIGRDPSVLWTGALDEGAPRAD